MTDPTLSLPELPPLPYEAMLAVDWHLNPQVAKDAITAWAREYATAAVLADRQARWQPMESAPKDDRTPILVTNGKAVAAVFWWPSVWMGTTHNGMQEPTHWMPAPPLP